MIFVVDATQQELGAAKRDDLESLFSMLITADRDGQHFFVANRELCKWIEEHVHGLGRQQLQHLQAIGEQYAIRGSLPNNAYRHTKVVMGDMSLSFQKAGGLYSIGHKVFIKKKYAKQQTALVVENIESDGEFYSFLFKEISKSSTLPPYDFDLIHGAGDTMGSLFRKEVEKTKVVVGIVDTDKMAPCDKQSGTANKLSTFSSNNLFLGETFYTIGHETENYIPYQCLTQIYNVPSPHPSLKTIDQIFPARTRSVERDKFLLHFDLKDGLDMEQLLSKQKKRLKSAATVQWVREHLSQYDKDLNQLKICGFGKNTSSQFLKNSSAKREFGKFVSSTYWEETFATYFANILWCMAAPPAKGS